MEQLNPIIYSVPFFLLISIFILSYFDVRKKRTKISHPFISFVIPCYNHKEFIEKAIKSIFESYDHFELFVINDNSQDLSLKEIKRLQRKYRFHLINNKKNLGKARSINMMADRMKGELLFVVDADTMLTPEALTDIIKRFDYDSKVAAVSCPYQARNRGFLARMQNIEYTMSKMAKLPQNFISVLALWGGCLAVKKDLFQKVGKFSENALLEDVDLAFKLYRANYKVEQSAIPVKTGVPVTFRAWIKQKMRWISGGTQCFLTYTRLCLKNPIILIFNVCNLLLLTTFLYYFSGYISASAGLFYKYFFISTPAESIANIVEHLWALDRNVLSQALFIKLGLMTFTLPYVIMQIDSPKEWHKALYLIPFSIIYSPLFAIISLLGWFIGIRKYFLLRNSTKRAW